ncbi:hypothetical protein L798_14182 [Zootermopsis nevadensis]|uniref:Uncharacterized protein n=2 Tax=Zootermopsis nevadensis TaxID=136037 RepID=A0A067QT25_ZOONE|nr:hypothetical protein L798_14182 [Zootermopsis nevadensis]
MTLGSWYDDSQVSNIKVEDVGGVKVEEDPVMITFPVIMAEHELLRQFPDFYIIFVRYVIKINVFVMVVIKCKIQATLGLRTFTVTNVAIHSKNFKVAKSSL